MHMPIRLTLLLTVVLTSAPAFGQTATSAPAPHPNAGLLGGRRSAPDEHMRYYDALNKAVKLDAQQQEQVQALLKGADDEFRAAREEMVPPEAVRTRMAETIKEIEAAKKAGESQKEAALIQERAAIIKSMITKREEMIAKMKQRDELLQREITVILRPDQISAFQEFWPNRNPAARRVLPDPYDGLIRSPIALKAATDRLGDLTADQKKAIEDAFKAHQEASRTASTTEPAKAATLRKLYNDVFAVFTDSQRQRVKAELTPKQDANSKQAASAPAVEPKP